jgi:hypothetical protein
VIAATVDWKVLGIAAVLLLVAMVLLYRMMSRDPDVRRTRYGFFVERDRYDQEPGWPELHPPVERTLPRWPDTTAELEPQPQPEPGDPPNTSG